MEQQGDATLQGQTVDAAPSSSSEPPPPLQAEVAGLRRAVRGSWAQLLRAVNAAAAAARERADDIAHIGGVRRLIGADELRVLVMRHCGVVCTDAAWDAVCDGCGGAASVASL
eukprot:COSAG01_NODE_7718_length_3085_cov_2.157066_5_plen_113_part_00